MDDGDGHHNFGIDGDGDGDHFKGDGRHVWLEYKTSNNGFGYQKQGLLEFPWAQFEVKIFLTCFAIFLLLFDD